MQPRTRGFSLIELLIVVAIILIIAAIAIPSLLRARIAANESSAVAAVRTINSAMITYNSTYPTVGYAAALLNLGPSAASPCTSSSATACLIDSSLANNGIPAGAGKSGFTFAASGAGGPPANKYYITATPVVLHETGDRSFCSVEDAVVRANPAGNIAGSEAACAGWSPLN
jgi:type IV pilus assembly protein PilA